MAGMSGMPIIILKDTRRESGMEAISNNIMAARAVADAVRSTLGPKGMDKLLVDSIGDVTITNDGVTILKEMDVQHPAAKMLIETLSQGGTVAFCGNGGSASDAQHLAGELVGRFSHERRAFRGIALTTDTSILTAVGNDYGFDSVFERQVDGLLGKGDLLVCLSTSGNSENVVRAARRAGELGARRIALTGASGGRLAEHVELCLMVPSTSTPRIQEVHSVIGHIVCDLVEDALIS